MVSESKTMPSILLKANRLRKTYGRGEERVHAVREVDLELLSSEFVAIMGASGSGKSTLLHLLGGLHRPDQGTIRFVESDMTSLSDAALTKVRSAKIGVIFQSFNLMPTLTALDNVAIPLLLQGVSKREARRSAEARLREVGLQDRLTHRPATLSGGEQQRVAIARA